MVIDLTLHGVHHRELYDRGLSAMFPLSGYTTAAERIPHPMTLAKEDSIARPRESAVEAAQYVFERFSGWSPSAQLLTTMQSELQIYT